MGKLEEYISSLEGKENIDPVVIASTLLELHNEEMDTAANKIASVELERDAFKSEVGESNQTITQLKAKNWDLANRVPAENASDQKPKDSLEEKDASELTFDDFFEEEK
jgi:hypothetical protein